MRKDGKFIRDLNNTRLAARRYDIGHYINKQLAMNHMTREDLSRCGLVDKANGGHSAGPAGPGRRDILSNRTLHRLTTFEQCCIHLQTIICLRRLFDDPIDIMMGLEHLPVIYGGLESVRIAKRWTQKDLARKTNTDHAMIYRVEAFSRWASDNQAGRLITPAGWIWDQLDGRMFGIGLVVQLRDVLEANIDDILGLSYR